METKTLFSFFLKNKAAQSVDVWPDQRLEEAVRKFAESLATKPEADLGKYLRSLIATEDKIRPEDVTVGYIHCQRKKHLYPTTRYNVGSSYGGYNEGGLQFMTQIEFDTLTASVDQRMAIL